MRYVFVGVEKLLQDTFLLCLLFGKPKSLSPIVGTLSMSVVNKSGIGLQDLVTSANKKYLSLLCVIRDIIRAVTGERSFSTANHLLELRE